MDKQEMLADVEACGRSFFEGVEFAPICREISSRLGYEEGDELYDMVTDCAYDMYELGDFTTQHNGVRCVDYLEPIYGPEFSEIVRRLHTVEDTYDIHVFPTDIDNIDTSMNFFRADMLINLEYSLSLLPDAIHEHKLSEFFFYSLEDNRLGYTHQQGDIHIGNMSSCSVVFSGISSDLSCASSSFNPNTVSATIHEIMHNQDDREIESEFCNEDDERCRSLEAFVNAAGVEERYPMFFKADGTLDESYAENAWAYQVDSPRTDIEFFAEFGALYVMNPDVVRESYPNIYSVFTTVYGGYEYEIDTSGGLTQISAIVPDEP
jgi:hypothetical protein